jgi:hypothetical protein
MNSWRSCTVSDLVEEGIIAPPMDGNHGETHPKGGILFEVAFHSLWLPILMVASSILVTANL